MKNWLKKKLGISDVEHALVETKSLLDLAKSETNILKQQVQLAEDKAKHLEDELNKRNDHEYAKNQATEKGEPFISINKVILDPKDPGVGGFELDWNEFFVAKLYKAGFKGETQEQVVDQWFQQVCRHIVLETYEQYEANQTGMLKINKKPIDDSRSEFS